jgi:hypothetical protein
VFGDAWVSGDAQVFGDARVFVYARVFDNAWVFGDAWVYGDARVFDNAWVFGDARVSGDACVYGDARVFDNAWVFGDADLITITKIGSENGTLNAFKQKDGSVMVSRGCFSGTLPEFKAAVENRHGDNVHGQIYQHAIKMIELRFGVSAEAS